jgi:predicted RNase H-like nuclease
MKKLVLLFVTIVLVSCGASSTNNQAKKPLYEVLTQQQSGGASIQFYEIISEQKEIAMLLGDKNLKRKIKKEDIQTANFVILNMGEKNSGGYSITVQKVEETADKILVTVTENQPEKSQITTDAITNPYCILKINSKKEIVFK